MSSKYINPKLARLYSIFGHIEENTNPGLLLIIVAIITIIISNSPLHHWYQSLLNITVNLGINDYNFFNHKGNSFTLHQFVNDAIMTFFFFAVGLEIKREILIGELSSFRQALLPIIAACGGMIMPIIIFYTFGKVGGFSNEALNGFAIPMATDIAFSIGVLSLLGKRVPISLKVFLLALAIVDDIGGIIVIAMFFSQLDSTSLMYILIACIAFTFLIIGNKKHINSKGYYAFFGIIIWYCFLQAGIHPTIAGVLVSFTVPARPHLNLNVFTKKIETELVAIHQSTVDDNESMLLNNNQIEHLNNIESVSEHAISPLQDFENNLHTFINFFVMPVFAFANAGIKITITNVETMPNICLAVIISLFLGKLTGIFSFTWLAIKLKISSLPKDMSWKNLLGISILGGIGFTVALFLASLSYPIDSSFLNQAKLGIIIGSLISGIAGYLVLKSTLQVKRQYKTTKNTINFI
jgi:NhaA family Na+:H+ antiporter